MKFDVKPVLTVGGASAQDVSAACNLKFNHEDNEINVRAAIVLFIIDYVDCVRVFAFVTPYVSASQSRSPRHETSPGEGFRRCPVECFRNPNYHIFVH